MEKGINVKRLTESAKIPTKANEADAGWDIYSDEDVIINANTQRLISTGISIEIPNGMVGLIWPRSGLAVKHGVDVFAGVVDSGYRGEVKVCLFNAGSVWTTPRVEIAKGDRIAQILFQPVPSFHLQEVDSLDDTDRGEGGFGSSGK
jgi:dUTP pyrophosphatase